MTITNNLNAQDNGGNDACATLRAEKDGFNLYNCIVKVFIFGSTSHLLLFKHRVSCRILTGKASRRPQLPLEVTSKVFMVLVSRATRSSLLPLLLYCRF